MYFLNMTLNHIRGRLAEVGVTQQDLANVIGFSPSSLNRILKGHRSPPKHFEARVKEALDRLEAAEKAAERARSRVLAKGRAA